MICPQMTQKSIPTDLIVITLKQKKKSLDSHHSSMDKQTEFCLYLSILFRNVKGNVYNNMVEYKMYLPREREFVNKEFMFPIRWTF